MEMKKLFIKFKQFNRYIFTENNEESILNKLMLMKKDLMLNSSSIIKEFSPSSVANQIISLRKKENNYEFTKN